MIANGLQIFKEYHVNVKEYEDLEHDEIGIKITDTFLANATAATKAIAEHAYGCNVWSHFITNGIIVYC